MKNLRKFLTIGVMGLTALSMSGLQVSAAAPQAGDLIKMDGLSAVYFLGNDGKRYVFPSESVFYSWHNDFSGVVTISASELASYPLGANVTVRPGTKLVKITTDPSVYAVEASGTLRKIASEADAIAIFGANWAKRVIDVSDAFFTNYTISTPMASGALPAGTLVKNSTSGAIYLFDGTNYRSIANEAAFNANRFSFANVITITNPITASGNSITGAESALNYDAQSGAGTGTVVTGSGLTASLSSATPASVSVPQNGTRIPMAKVNLTAANDGAVTVNSITVKRIGLSTFASIDKVWAEKDGVIVASKKSMNSNDESILTFSPAFTINAGQTVALDLIASFPTAVNATGNIGLSIASASAISATAASISGSFPINGNLMTPINYTVATLALTSNQASSNVKVGDEKVELGRFNIAFTGTDSKDVTLSSITVKNNGVEDLSKTTMNLYLEQAGNKVSTNYVIDGRNVTFYFPAGYELLKDDSSKDFYIKGDVISKENAAGISFALVLNKGTDLVAYEKSSGFGVNVNTVSGYTISNITIEAGAVTVSKKVTSPSATSVIKGSDNTVLIANVRADEAITSDGLILQYHSDGGFATTTNQFENARVYVNGILLDSFDPASSSSSTLSQTIDSTFTLNKGDNEVKVMVRAKTTATTSASFVARLDATSTSTDSMFYGMNPEYVISGNQATSISGSATSEAVTVQGAILNVVNNDGYGLNKVIVQGSTDVSLGKFVLQSQNDDIKVTSIKLDGNSTASTTTTTASSVYDMKLFVDGVQVGSTVDFGTSGVTFSSLNFTIAKDSTKNIEIKGSFDSAANGGFKTLLTVNAQDSRGTTVSGGSSVITGATTDFALSGQGTLTVDVAGNTPVAGLLATKAGLEQEVAQFKFTAINDSANLTEINVENTAGSSTDARIASVRLYDGATLVSQFVPVNAIGKFTINNNAIIVGANTSKTLSIKVVLNNIENDASSTNKVLTVKINDVKSKSSAGAVSTLHASATASSFLIRKTVPTIATMALPTSALTAGDQTIAKFTVTADANGDLEVGRFTMTLATTTSSSVSTSSLPLLVNGVTKTGAVATLVGNKMTISFAKEIVAAGSSKTFEVVAIAGASAANQSVTARLLEDAAYDADSTVGGVEGDFVWSDGASITTETWNSGHTVKGLPTTTWVLSN